MRSLIIRQLFVLVDLALALALIAVLWLVVARVLRPEAAAPAPGAVEGATAQPLELREVRARADYDVIANSALFGPGGQIAPPQAPIDVPANDPVVATKLPLRLVGTAAAAPTDPVATATIENVASKTQAVYYLNDEIMAGVKLVEVQRRKVLLENNQKRELLSMDEEPPAPAGPVVASAADAGPKLGASPLKISMKKDELITELSANYADILGQVSPEQHTDASGKVDGYTSKNLANVPLAKKMGLQNDDVLQQINGVTIDSPEKIVEVANKFKDNRTFQLTIQRNGKRQVITYNLE
ncbi:MAG: hypothetical protein HZB26_12210 [Candidatus Hydrogenedentes bacterium]|nr:hypothetical protein [Candidatus Hydrogenedentota bacterium]